MPIKKLLSRLNPRSSSKVVFHNTLTGQKDPFSSHSHSKEVRMYSCGPTVYGRQHIGNLSMFVFTDTLHRMLEWNGYKVKHAINFTDFGHLSGDNAGNSDEGEDRMTKGLKREKMALTMENMHLLGQKYANIFLDDLRTLNIDTNTITFPYASEYVPAQIALIKTLEEKGYTYTLKDGVYYDTSRFPNYGKLGNIDLAGLKEGARVATAIKKRNPTDFLLWKADKKLGWDSPWGKGFPGWHIECSAMINSCLGKQIDIHTGGIEHIPVHHNNEIAQSEAAIGKKPFSRFWMHRAHVQLDGAKISKSDGNVVYLSDIIERGYHPLALRYLFFGAHYRTPANFTWEALDAAQRSLVNLWLIRLSKQDVKAEPAPEQWMRAFRARINDDLDTAGALAVLWQAVREGAYSDAEILGILEEADKVLGLRLSAPDPDAKKLAAAEIRTPLRVDEIPAEIRSLIADRDAARAKRDFATADTLRDKITELGYTLEDATTGPKVYKS